MNKATLQESKWLRGPLVMKHCELLFQLAQDNSSPSGGFYCRIHGGEGLSSNFNCLGGFLGNSIGVFFATSFGESHGASVGVVIDGCPGGLSICLDEIQQALGRRRPGQSRWVSPRDEKDRLNCSSGLEGGKNSRLTAEFLGCQHQQTPPGLSGYVGGLPPFARGLELGIKMGHSRQFRRGTLCEGNFSSRDCGLWWRSKFCDSFVPGWKLLPT